MYVYIIEISIKQSFWIVKYPLLIIIGLVQVFENLLTVFLAVMCMHMETVVSSFMNMEPLA